MRGALLSHPLPLPHSGAVANPPVPSATFHSAAITAIVTLPPVLLPVSQRNKAARFLTASADGMVGGGSSTVLCVCSPCILRSHSISLAGAHVMPQHTRGLERGEDGRAGVELVGVTGDAEEDRKGGTSFMQLHVLFPPLDTRRSLARWPMWWQVIMWHGPSMTPLRWLSFGLPIASISLTIIRMT